MNAVATISTATASRNPRAWFDVGQIRQLRVRNQTQYFSNELKIRPFEPKKALTLVELS